MNKDCSVMGRLIQYMVEARTAELPAPVVQKAKIHILDTLASMVSGSQLKAGQFAISYAEQQGGPPEAQVAAGRHRVSAVNAALANGMLAHADETDDGQIDSGIHPGAVMVAAALAMAERQNVSGADFMRAVVLGYDVGCRTINALGLSAVKDRNQLPHGIGGTIGAAAAAGNLAGLTSEQLPHLYSYSAQQASGILTYHRDTEHIEKAFICGGMPARNGVTAATMVQAGFTGVDDVFTGDNNFFIAFSANPRPEALVSELGSRYEVMVTHIKKYCVGFPILYPLEGLMLIMKEHRIDAQNVEKVVVWIDETGAHAVNDREMPDINLQYLFAVTLIDGDLSFEAAHSMERMRDPRVLELKARISLIADATLTRGRPPLPRRQAIVEVTANDGRKIEKRVTTLPGIAENPLSVAEMAKKSFDLMQPVLGAQRTQQLISTVGQLETLAKVRELCALLKR